MNARACACCSLLSHRRLTVIVRDRPHVPCIADSAAGERRDCCVEPACTLGRLLGHLSENMRIERAQLVRCSAQRRQSRAGRPLDLIASAKQSTRLYFSVELRSGVLHLRLHFHACAWLRNCPGSSIFCRSKSEFVHNLIELSGKNLRKQRARASVIAIRIRMHARDERRKKYQYPSKRRAIHSALGSGLSSRRPGAAPGVRSRWSVRQCGDSPRFSYT